MQLPFQLADVAAQRAGGDRIGQHHGGAARARQFGAHELVQALEDDLGLTIDDEEFSGELFETVGTLADFVESKRLSV